MTSLDSAAERLPDGDHIDPATVPDARLPQLRLLGPQRLYYQWEKRHWAASALDFDRDRRDWSLLGDQERETFIQGIAPFFAGEERVAAAFAPIVLAADDEQEAAFLATQQVDEVRHMQFFDRFWSEVLVPEQGAGEAAIAAARARCNEAFAELFDRRLMGAVERLRLDPRDVDAKVEAVTIYHLIVEGTLGLTGQRFVLDYLQSASILPAIAEGFRNVKRDEHRHVAWGTWFLRNRCVESERHASIVQDTLMELLPVAAAVMVHGAEAACDGLDACEFLGYPSAELNHYALQGLPAG